MNLLVIILSLFAHYGMSGVGFFMFDTAIVDWHGHDEIVQGTGTACTIYVKHGTNSVVSQSGISNPTLNSINYNNEQFTWYFLWDASVYYDTWIWTSCQDPMLVDYFRLFAPDGSTMFGENDMSGTCMSTDQDAVYDLDNYDNQPDWFHSWGIQICYQTIWFGMGHASNILGWRGGYLNNPMWFQNRRKLQEEMASLPSVTEIHACEEDSTKSDEECASLVEQILDFQIAHQEMWEPITSNSEAVDSSDDGELEESIDADQEEVDENLQESSSALRRVLRKL